MNNLTPQQREAGYAYADLLDELVAFGRLGDSPRIGAAIGLSFGMALALEHPEYASTLRRLMDSSVSDGTLVGQDHIAVNRFVEHHPLTVHGRAED